MKKIVSCLCAGALCLAAALTLSGCLTSPHGGGGGKRGGEPRGGGGPGGGGGGRRSFEVEGEFDYSNEWDISQEAEPQDL